MAYNTGNPIGSTDPRDLYDNAQNLDNAVNSGGETWKDRRGVTRRTLEGIDNAAAVVLAGLGYAPPVAYTAGINVTLSTQTVEYAGEAYAPVLSALPFITSGTFETAKFRLVQGLAASDLAASNGAALVGFQHAGAGAVARTSQDKLRERVSVKDFGAVGDGITDDTSAINAAINAINAGYSKGLEFGPGVFLTDGGHVVNYSGVQIRGSGIDATEIKLKAGTTQSGAFILGNKVSTTVTRQVALRDMSVDCNGQDKYAFEMYGCRDGSYVSNIYIKRFTGSCVRLNMSGNGSGVAAGKMNQGVKLTQIAAESALNITAPNGVFDIDGTFETTLDTCCFKGATAATNNGKAFVIGHEGETRNVVIINAAIPHLLNGGIGGNAGIHYGQWARECRDIFTTFENIDGSAVVFDGSTVSGNKLPFQCYTLYPRLYAVADASKLNPAFVFVDASACRVGPVTGYVTSKTWVLFDSFVSFQEKNIVEISGGGVSPNSLVSGSNIIFNAGTPPSNAVHGFSSSDENLRGFLINSTGISFDHKTNGSITTHSSSYDTFDLAGSTGARWRDASGDVLFELTQGGSLGANQSVAYLRYRGSSGEVVARVTVGPEDSGGTGYRSLIVPN